jgi:hypothetical protein
VHYHKSINRLIEQAFIVYDSPTLNAEEFQFLANSLSLFSQYLILLLTCLGHHSQSACSSRKSMEFLEFVKAAGRRLLSAQECIVAVSDEMVEHEGNLPIQVSFKNL